ncbi:MAG: ATP-binding protein [Candidatus Vogelbacteria bacterium]|nr:ATP-binding protein [Candidatus Vogelbacteria bacterium]
MYIHRSQEAKIHADLQKKMVFIVGPRQVGKTWLAKKIAEKYRHSLYLNYDSTEDKAIIKNQSWLPDTELLILDELHKMKGWKNYLKGLYDTKKDGLKILVTGSARMENFRKSGDSLAGRFFVHHLLPFSLSELQGMTVSHDINRLIERSGFPEPFLAETTDEAARWRKFYIDSLIREDVLNFETVADIRALYDVFEIVRRSVGAPLSFSNIARDVGISPVTVKKYISVLESLYIVFTVRTYTTKIKRSILKEVKVYFYDTGIVVGDAGTVFENFVALGLLKHTELINDVKGADMRLMYLRTKEGKEADFVLIDNARGPEKIIEVKYRDTAVSKNLLYFKKKYGIPALQIVKSMNKVGLVVQDVSIVRAEEFLTDIDKQEYYTAG